MLGKPMTLRQVEIKEQIHYQSDITGQHVKTARW
jgi:hypothetical protein